MNDELVERVVGIIRDGAPLSATAHDLARTIIAECEKAGDVFRQAADEYTIQRLNANILRLEAEAAAMRTCLEAFDESPEDGYKLIRAALSSDAGKVLLAVVQAAEEVRTNGEWTDGEQRGDWKISPEVYATLSDALTAWRKP